MSGQDQDQGERDPRDAEARRLVGMLNSLLEGERAVAALVALGQRAVEPLRKFLLEGRPSTVYQPRLWAVEALGGLGARSVLEDYLTGPLPADLQLRFAEEVVRSAAVREFLRWPGPATEEFLLGLARQQMLRGLVEVFGTLRLAEAIPFLDRALEDDLCRLPAEQALAAMGERAREALILSASARLPSGGDESPSSLRRRRSVLNVLAEIGIRERDWPGLRGLLEEDDPEIVVRVCGLAVKTGIREAASRGAERLIGIAGHAQWFLLEDIAACLLAWFDTAHTAIEREVERRMAQPEAMRVQDQTLRLLLRVLRRSEAQSR